MIEFHSESRVLVARKSIVNHSQSYRHYLADSPTFRVRSCQKIRKRKHLPTFMFISIFFNVALTIKQKSRNERNAIIDASERVFKQIL